MSAELLIAPEVSLLPTMPVQLPPPLFQLDQTLKFCKVPTGDFGRVVGYVFAAAASVQAIGFHSRNSRPLEAFSSINTRANSGLVSSPLNSC
jgi:hypothetical protein